MDAYYELFDLASGNMVENYDCEQDAMDALMRAVEEHGISAIGAFALSHVEGSHRRLVAMQDDLVSRVEGEMGRLVPHDRAS